MVSVLAAELLKVRSRWMPYVLLLPVVGVLAFQTFFGYFAVWRHDRDFEGLYVSVLPWSLPSLLDLTQFLGAIVLAVLVASLTGTEYGWGTVRQALIRGQTRRQYLSAKLLGIAVLAAVGFLLVLGLGILFSAIVTAVDDRPLTLDLPSGGGPSPGDVALMMLRAGYGMLPYMLMAFALSVVGRSTTLGVAGVLVYVIVEAIVIGILGGVGGATADARIYFIGHNVVALLVANQVGGVDYFSLALRDNPPASDLPDPAVAALVIGLYCLGFLAIAFWVFQRRDLHA
ncbi:MAG: ABC transporter permease subunit [Chloroflexi bacterium]|nr:ABC transporter permease subunit [Chloroflexota bacterium]